MSDESTRQPIADVLGGLEVHPLEPGWTALEAFLLVKALDQNGHISWAYRTTHQLNREELLGALAVHVGLLRRELLEEWSED